MDDNRVVRPRVEGGGVLGCWQKLNIGLVRKKRPPREAGISPEGHATGSTPEATKPLEDPMALGHVGNADLTPNPAQSVPHPSECPVCRLPAERETHKRSITGIATSLFACPKGHLWQTQWAEVA